MNILHIHMIYLLTGKKFWNLFHLQPMRDHKVSVKFLFQVMVSIFYHTAA